MENRNKVTVDDYDYFKSLLWGFDSKDLRRKKLEVLGAKDEAFEFFS